VQLGIRIDEHHARARRCSVDEPRPAESDDDRGDDDPQAWAA
jgi:hypothetical protein